MDLDALRARLKPWHAALQTLGQPEYKEAPLPLSHRRAQGDHEIETPYVVWIRVPMLAGGKIGRVKLDKVCEALALLTLLARIDLDAWKRELITIFSADPSFSEWIQYAVQPATPRQRFAVGIQISTLDRTNIWGLRHLHSVNAALRTQPRPEFESLRAQMEAMVRRQPELVAAKSYLDVAVRLELYVSPLEGVQSVANLLAQSLTHITTQQQATSSLSRQSRGDAGPPQLTIAEVVSLSTPSNRIDKQVLFGLQKIVECGVRVGFLAPLECPHEARSCSHVIGALRSLTALDGANLGVRCVGFTVHSDPYLVPSVLTAVQESPVVDAVVIQAGKYFNPASCGQSSTHTPRHDHVDMWERLAYSLFSHHAHHGISRLTMDLDRLQSREVDAVRRILAAPNPLARLECQQDDRHQRIEAIRFCLNNPYVEQPRDFYETLQPVQVRVISAPDEAMAHTWWCVVLPGCGTAWVHPNDLVDTTATVDKTVPTHSESRPSFPYIRITSMTDQSVHAATDLIELIGRGTTHVDLREYVSGNSVEMWCRRVLASCPKLESLHVRRAPCCSLAVFMEASVAHPWYQLRELSAQCVTVDSDDVQSTCAFFSMLCDATYPLTAHLQTLDLRFGIESGDATQQVVDSVLSMLRWNRQLASIRLEFALPDELLPVFEMAFSAHENENVVVRLTNLGIRQKLAVLSLAESGAFKFLGSDVLSTIFQFAAQARTRHVKVWFTEFDNFCGDGYY